MHGLTTDIIGKPWILFHSASAKEQLGDNKVELRFTVLKANDRIVVIFWANVWLLGQIYTRISFNLCVCVSYSIFQFAVVWLTNQKVSCKFDLCYNNSFELAYQENRSRERQLEENLTLVQVQPNEFLFLQLQVSIFPNISWLQNSSQENGRQESIQFSISCCLLHIRINFLKVHGW